MTAGRHRQSKQLDRALIDLESPWRMGGHRSGHGEAHSPAVDQHETSEQNQNKTEIAQTNLRRACSRAKVLIRLDLAAINDAGATFNAPGP